MNKINYTSDVFMGQVINWHLEEIKIFLRLIRNFSLVLDRCVPYSSSHCWIFIPGVVVVCCTFIVDLWISFLILLLGYDQKVCKKIFLFIETQWPCSLILEALTLIVFMLQITWGKMKNLTLLLLTIVLRIHFLMSSLVLHSNCLWSCNRPISSFGSLWSLTFWWGSSCKM